MSSWQILIKLNILDFLPEVCVSLKSIHVNKLRLLTSVLFDKKVWSLLSADLKFYPTQNRALGKIGRRFHFDFNKNYPGDLVHFTGWNDILEYFNIRGRSQTTFTRLLLFLTTYPTALTFFMVWKFTKSGHSWTTYLPRLVSVVYERPLM